jgi:bifunctional non-homologous end joining protein LigD
VSGPYRPQLATLVKAPPAGDEWLHEIKYDGYRIGCQIDGREVRLLSRTGKDWTGSFPEIRDAAAALRVRDTLLDGEVAMVLPDGRTSFQALQNASSSRERRGLEYFVFDLLHDRGVDLRSRPLEARKKRLESLLARLPRDGRLRYAAHVVGEGPAFFRQACARGLEGIVSKRRDLPYTAGRGRGWLKVKCVQRQELVIGGFTDPKGSRTGIGALLVGVHDARGALVFAGKVGTGFTQRSAVELRRRLERLERKTCPFSPCPTGRIARDAHWVAPELVAEVAFTEWTGEGKIRHPSFQGLREDKRPSEIVREQGADPPPEPKRRGGNPSPRTGRPGRMDVAGISLSHPERVLYPDPGLTKLDIARYYEAIADWIVPHVSGRPLTLVRCPEGVGTSCFYMKHSQLWAPSALRRVRIKEKTKIGEYLIADSIAAVVALVQMDVLEIHTWNSTADHLEHPDRLVFDLDPGPAVRWSAVVTAARLVRDVLHALGLASFVKTTGGAGLHVVVPLAPAAGWDECLAFTRAFAEALVRQNPRAYTTEFVKAGREGKILIDYLRNNRTNTSVAAFSTRARAGASVSVPLAWAELGPRLRSDHFTVRNVPARLAALRGDPWRDYWKSRQRLSKAARAALAAFHA